MGIPKRHPVLIPAEYLEIERAAPFRSEYFDGNMFAMAGGSPRHSLIKTNVLGGLWLRLKGRPCTAYDSDLRIRVSASGLYTYPDASVICGALEFDDAQRDTVLNPTVIVEVLSDSTEAYERGKKFDHYRRIATLQEYVLIAQDSPSVERFSRNPDKTWTLMVFQGLEQALELPSIGITVPLEEIFDKVDFAEGAATDAAT